MLKGIIHCHADYILKERSLSLNASVLSGYISLFKQCQLYHGNLNRETALTVTDLHLFIYQMLLSGLHVREKNSNLSEVIANNI